MTESDEEETLEYIAEKESLLNLYKRMEDILTEKEGEYFAGASVTIFFFCILNRSLWIKTDW